MKIYGALIAGGHRSRPSVAHQGFLAWDDRGSIAIAVFNGPTGPSINSWRRRVARSKNVVFEEASGTRYRLHEPMLRWVNIARLEVVSRHPPERLGSNSIADR